MNLIFAFTGWALFVAPLGARLLHIVYESPDYYLKNPLQIFAIWQGGFVYYGGLISLLLFAVLYFKVQVRERTFSETADLLTPALCFGTGFGRVACYLQSCCYGRVSNSWWAISGRHPTQLYILIWEFLLLCILLQKEKNLSKKSGQYFLTWLILSSLGRFLVEFYRDDFRGPFILSLSVSQLMSLGIISSGLIFWSRAQFADVNS